MSQGTKSATRPITVGPFEAWPDEWALRVSGRHVHVSRREFQVLHELMSRTGHVVPREALYERVWAKGPCPPRDRSVDVHIRKLRAKLAAAAPQWHAIHTHFGIGYRFEPERLSRPTRTGGQQ